LKFIKQKNSFLTFFCLCVSGLPLFLQESLHAAAKPEQRSNEMTGKRVVKADSLSGTGGLKSTIFFTAKDSVIYRLDRRNMELWGKATIDHEGTSVKAPKIIIDLDTSLLHAFSIADSSAKAVEPAFFTDREGSFNAETMTYNFRTGKGETSNVSSSSQELIFSGEHVTRLENGNMIIRHGTLTTCDDLDPHYWFTCSRMTIVPDRKVTATSLIMYVRPELFSRRLPALPLLALPYMVFPLNNARSSGFLMPSLGNDSDRGYSLSNLGYFWAINDYMDLRLEGDISLNGSWRLGDRFRYVVPNLFTGVISGDYKRYPHYTDWNANIVHNQVFDPTTRLDVNFQLQGAPHGYNLNSINSESMVTQQSNARATLAKTFNDENSIGLFFYNRSEELNTHYVSQSVGASFYQNRIYPFRSALSGNDWKSDVSITTGASFASEFTSRNLDASSSGYSSNINGEVGYYHEFGTGSKALFTQGFNLQGRKPDNGRYDDTYSGTSVEFPLRMRSTLFSYFNVNPSLTYVHSLHPDDGNQDFSTTIFAVDASTRVYGILETGLFEHILGLKALRHTFVPVITYVWNPAFSGSGYDYSRHLYDWPDQNPFNPAIPEGQSTIGITLKNLFHGKFRGSSSLQEESSVDGDHSKQLLSLTASTAYNVAADSFHLAPLIVMASSNALSENLLFSAGSMYDFYSYDPLTGERVNRFNSEEGKGLLRFVKGFLDMSMSVQGSRQGGTTTAPSRSPIMMNTLQTFFNMGNFGSIDYSLPWELRFSLFLQADRSNPLQPETTSLINAAATAALSKEWHIAMNTGYDLQNRSLVLPMLQISRDLHCWQMSVQWVPFGQFQSYAIEIGLKAPQLKDIHFRQAGNM
jgi:lipopolysaccharide assembly outer membrane protein LptD (OstA)